MEVVIRRATGLLLLLLVAAPLLGATGGAVGALERPTYLPGDRWVYVLEGTLSSLPGVSPNRNRSLALSLEGKVEMEVAGAPQVIKGVPSGTGIPVTIHTSGFLNGTFVFPGPLRIPASLSGGFTAQASELWEDRGYLPVEYHGTSTYQADISYILTTSFELATRFNAITSVTQGTSFPLDVGQASSATLRTDLNLSATAAVGGRRVTTENQTAESSTWRRTVVSLEAVRVEAGTFEAYRVDQGPASLLDIVGAPTPAGGNETSYFSNEVGYYVKRVIYLNATQIAEMRLKSYSRGVTGGTSLPLPAIAAVAGVGAVGAPAVAWVLLRRKRSPLPQAPEAPPDGDRPEAQRGPPR